MARSVVVEDGVELILAMLRVADRAALLRQWKSAERKYQQRGRCARLPPIVAMLRICGVAACAHAAASAGQRLWTPACASIAASVDSGPSSSSPDGAVTMPSSPVMPRRLTRRDGASRPSFMRSSRSTPPALTTTPGANCAIASSILCACTHSNDFIGAPPCRRACRARRAPPPASSAAFARARRWRCRRRWRWPPRSGCWPARRCPCTSVALRPRYCSTRITSISGVSRAIAILY